jgi:hypothetical protein
MWCDRYCQCRPDIVCVGPVILIDQNVPSLEGVLIAQNLYGPTIGELPGGYDAMGPTAIADSVPTVSAAGVEGGGSRAPAGPSKMACRRQSVPPAPNRQKTAIATAKKGTSTLGRRTAKTGRRHGFAKILRILGNRAEIQGRSNLSKLGLLGFRSVPGSWNRS